MYEKTNWQDRVVDETTKEVMQEGTKQDAKHFNNIENGIVDNELSIALMITHMLALEKTVKREEHVVTLKNTDIFPFSNAVATIPLDEARVDTNYAVDVEVVSSDGYVGSVKIFDKLANAFKVKYEGTSKEATLKMAVTGGKI